MRINKINFTGKAYFLDSVDQVIKPEHRTRIENYAKKLDKDTDVVVFGQKTDNCFYYGAHMYHEKEYSIVLEKDGPKVEFSTKDGIKKMPTREIYNWHKIPLPIYNAYIIADYNKEYMSIAPYRKQFDFTEGANNKLIRPNNGLEDDFVEY